MNGDRAILHSDLNCFYASVEMMLDPSLRGSPMAVGGSPEERHGIVLAKNDEAKALGIKTGMTIWEAKVCCPNLKVVPPQYDEYLKYSKLTQEIYKRYTDLIEPFGMDECWLDVTGSRTLFGSGRDIAERIRKSVKEELGLTVSIGVSFTKTLAKLGSDMKKPDAITEITRENFRDVVWPLDVGDLLYCGEKTKSKLAWYNIKTIGQLAESDEDFIRKLFGVNGVELRTYARGEDMSRVAPLGFVSPVKSVGHGITCVADLESLDEVKRVILALSQDVGHRLRVHELAARSVKIWVRGKDLYGQMFSRPLEVTTQLPCEIAAAAFAAFRRGYMWTQPVRSITVQAANLVPASDPSQTSLFVDNARRARRERLEDTIEELRGRFGKFAMTYASLLGDLKMPGDGREKVRMPGLIYR